MPPRKFVWSCIDDVWHAEFFQGDHLITTIRYTDFDLLQEDGSNWLTFAVSLPGDDVVQHD